MYLCKISKKISEQILIKFLEGLGHGPRTNHLDFGCDPDPFMDYGSFSRFLRLTDRA